MKGGRLKCVLCQSGAETRAALVGHYLGEHKTWLGVYKCDACPFSTRTREVFTWHRGARHGSWRRKARTSSSDGTLPGNPREKEGTTTLSRRHRWTVPSMFKCPSCLYSGRSSIAFRSHVRAEHGGEWELLPCSFQGCSYGAQTRVQIARHLAKGTHGPRVREGSNCMEMRGSEVSRSSLFRKRLRKEGKRMLACVDCGLTSRWRSTLVHHINSRHPVPKIHLDPSTNRFTCSECKYSSKRKASIESHIALKHKPPAEKFKCSQCPYTTKVKARLDKHGEKHSKTTSSPRKGKRVSHKYKQFARDSEGLFRCTECDYSTKWRSSIIAHVDNYHNPDAEEFKCAQCSYKTRVKAYLQQHRVTHRVANTTGKKLKRTPRKYKQIVRDSELNVYRCSECEYSTKWRSSIIAHVDNYHNPDAEIYSCPKCAYNCKVKSYFVQHSRTHDAKPIKCEGCSFVTKNKRLLEQHQRKCLHGHHPQSHPPPPPTPSSSSHPGSVISSSSSWGDGGLVYLPIKLEPGLEQQGGIIVTSTSASPPSTSATAQIVLGSQREMEMVSPNGNHLGRFPSSMVVVGNHQHKQRRGSSSSSNAHHTHHQIHSSPGSGVGVGVDAGVREMKVEPGLIKIEPELIKMETEVYSMEEGGGGGGNGASATLMSDWSEESIPDVNSLEPSIEPSPDLSLAIEMNLNDHDLIFEQPQQEVGCPYCAYVTYSTEEMYQHMAIHQHPIHYYYSDQPVSL